MFKQLVLVSLFVVFSTTTLNTLFSADMVNAQSSVAVIGPDFDDDGTDPDGIGTFAVIGPDFDDDGTDPDGIGTLT